MKDFFRTEVSKEELAKNAEAYQDQWRKDKLKSWLGYEASEQVLEAIVLDQIIDSQTSEYFRNDTYQVKLNRHEDMGLIELSIRRIDRNVVHDWRDLQEIKNKLVGPEHEGVELFPAESRRVDSANQYYLWVMMDGTYRFPFGFKNRCVSGSNVGKSKQRPFTHDTRRDS